MLLIGAIPDAAWVWVQRVLWGLEVAIAFGLLITFHEFGHYIFGKLTGMKVEEFAIGFGKKIIGWKKGETQYSIRMIPVGGYCKIYGMGDDLVNEDGSIPEDAHRGFRNRPIWARFIVIIAGSAMNLVLAVILIAIAGMTIGFNYSGIYDVVKGSPAEKAGIKPGEKVRLFAYHSKPSNISDLVQRTSSAGGLTLKVIDSDNKTRDVVVHSEVETGDDGKPIKRIGVWFDENGNYSPTVDRVMYGSPYDLAGLMPGDTMTEIGGEPVTGIAKIAEKLVNAPDESIDVKVKRGDKEYKFNLKGYKIYRTGMIAQTVKSGNGWELDVKNAIFDTPAFTAMLKPGMRVLEVDDKPITEDFVWSTYEMEKGPVWIKLKMIDPKSKEGVFNVVLPRVMPHPGISYRADWIRVSPLAAFPEAVKQAKVFGMMAFDVLGGLFTQKTKVSEMSGPLGIITFTYQAASWGIVNLIIVISLISVNLAIVNLLPLPALDGGWALLLIGELIVRKPLIGTKIENLVSAIGLILLLAFMLLITFFDVSRLTSGV